MPGRSWLCSGCCGTCPRPHQARHDWHNSKHTEQASCEGGTNTCEGGNCKQVGACIDGAYPGKACPAGAASCQKQNNWYYQCLPGSGSAAGGPTASTPAVGDLKLWDQCGGEGGACKQVGTCVDGPYPGKACPAGSSCQKQNIL